MFDSYSVEKTSLQIIIMGMQKRQPRTLNQFLHSLRRGVSALWAEKKLGTFLTFFLERTIFSCVLML